MSKAAYQERCYKRWQIYFQKRTRFSAFGTDYEYHVFDHPGSDVGAGVWIDGLVFVPLESGHKA